jgi:RNA polymerase sigma factor (sigma-70 family)
MSTEQQPSDCRGCGRIGPVDQDGLPVGGPRSGPRPAASPDQKSPFSPRPGAAGSAGLESKSFFERDVAGLLAKAADGDRAAWERLFAVFGGMIWSIGRAHGLSDADADDVSQNTWLRLVEHMDRIEQPERIGGWLAITARRECGRVLRDKRRRVLVADGDDLPLVGADGADPDARLLADELAGEVSAAYNQLPSRCQAMLGPLGAEPSRSYRELARVLEMPFGSIGPTRQRCIECLRRMIESAPMAKNGLAARRAAARGGEGLREIA